MKFVRMLGASFVWGLLGSTALAGEGEGNITPSLTLSGTVAATSDYVYRGITQNDEKPAIQGSIDVAHASGVYGGVWGSPVDFNDGNEAEIELDWYAGYSYESGAWSGDVRLTYFWYPGADRSLDYDYAEISYTAGYDFEVVSLGAMLAYSPEYFGDTGDAEYVQAKLDVPLPHDFSAHAYVGHQWVEDNASYGLPDITDWNIGVGYEWKGATFDLSYIDTNLSKRECADGCEARVVGTVSYTF